MAISNYNGIIGSSYSRWHPALFKAPLLTRMMMTGSQFITAHKETVIADTPAFAFLKNGSNDRWKDKEKERGNTTTS